MRSSLWILNSALLIIGIVALGFIYFSHKEIPGRYKLDVSKQLAAQKVALAPVDPTRIYIRDLFGTYIPTEISPVKEEVKLPAVPPLPQARPVIALQPVPPQFLDPLSLTLAGIFAEADESKSRAIIVNNKTKVQKSYKIGDLLEDAELIRIFENKVMFIRSNGQEELLFIDADAAQSDPEFNQNVDWSTVVHKENETNYSVDPATFVRRIPHLAYLLESLDAMTVYKKGQAFGIRIGALSAQSIGYSLGLSSGDIILSIQDIPTADIADRVEIYNIIRNMSEGSTIQVKLLREKRVIDLIYSLRTLEKLPKGSNNQNGSINEPISILTSSVRRSDQEKQKLLQAQANFRPEIQQMLKRDNQAIARKMKRKSLTESIAT